MRIYAQIFSPYTQKYLRVLTTLLCLHWASESKFRITRFQHMRSVGMTPSYSLGWDEGKV